MKPVISTETSVAGPGVCDSPIPLHLAAQLGWPPCPGVTAGCLHSLTAQLWQPLTSASTWSAWLFSKSSHPHIIFPLGPTHLGTRVGLIASFLAALRQLVLLWSRCWWALCCSHVGLDAASHLSCVWHCAQCRCLEAAVKRKPNLSSLMQDHALLMWKHFTFI